MNHKKEREMTYLQMVLVGFSMAFGAAVLAFQIALDRATERELDENARLDEEGWLRLPESARRRRRTPRG